MADDEGDTDSQQHVVRLVRTVLGGLVILVILGLIVGETFTDAAIAEGRLWLLISLAGALLGVDIAKRYMPFRVVITDDDD